jgi:hypothetical protein
MRITEQLKFIPVIESKDYGGAGIDGDSINMALLHQVAFAMEFGAITGDSVLKFYAGATAGTKTTALAYQYKLGGGDYKAASADVPGTLTDVASTGLTLTAATYDHRQLLVEIRSVQMPDGKPWLTLEISSTANPMNVGCTGVAEMKQDNSVTAI